MRGAQRRADLVQPRLDLDALRLRVRRLPNLAPIRGGDAALDVHRAPLRRRPGVAAVERVAASVLQPARHAERLARDEDEVWHLGEPRDQHQPRAGANQPAAFVGRTDREAGLVAEEDQRQVKGVAELHQASDFFRGLPVGGAAVFGGVVDHHADGVPVDARQTGDPRAAPVRLDFKERAAVEHQVENPPRVVDAAAVAGDDREQFLFPALRIVVGRDPRRRLPDVLRQIAQEAPYLLHRLGLGVGEVLHDSGLIHMHLLAAQLFLADLQSAAGLHDRRAAHEQLAGVPDHHVEMAVGRDHRRSACNGAEHGGDDRRAPDQVVDARAAADFRTHDIGPAQLFKMPHAAARGIEQPHERDAVHVGVADRPAALLADETVGRAAANGEVVALHRHFAPVDIGHADHAVGGREADELVAVPLGTAGQHAGLGKVLIVDEQRDPLAHGELAAALVEGDVVGPAHLPRQLGAPLDLIQFALPGHRSLRA